MKITVTPCSLADNSDVSEEPFVTFQTTAIYVDTATITTLLAVCWEYGASKRTVF